jgi:hypothetical protein
MSTFGKNIRKHNLNLFLVLEFIANASVYTVENWIRRLKNN